jgi:uncharacterized protein YllA (UPF0747 family)
MYVNFEELRVSQLWLDFLSGAGREPLSLAFPDQIDRLKKSRRKGLELSQFFIPEDKWLSPRTIDNIQRLRQSDWVAVVAAIPANILGGTASHFFKCLTAVKVSEELTRRSIPAVPVCWISGESVSKSSIVLLDEVGELHNLSPTKSIAELISEIETLGCGTFDSEVIQMLVDAYSGDAPLHAGSARIFSGLMKEWGLVSLSRRLSCSDASRESEYFAQSAVLPASVSIVGPEDILSFSAASPQFDAPEWSRPIGWPAMSATILDSRSRKTLEKYNLSLGDLFAGEIEAVNKIQFCMPDPDKLAGLQFEVEKAMTDLEGLVSAGDDFLKIRNLCKEKIVYQIEKLRKNLETAIFNKRQVAERRLHKACNFLAPNGYIQERELGVYFLLRYSSSVLGRLYAQLNAAVLKHQLIAMD